MTSSIESAPARPAPSLQLGPWRPIYTGVQHAIGASFLSCRHGRQMWQRVTALRVDLKATGLDFRTTPAAGTGNGLTNGTTISEFVEGTPGVVLAINANLSGYALGTEPGGTGSAPHQLVGLAVNEGKIVCDPTQPAAGVTNDTPNVPDETYIGCTALTIHGKTGDFTARIGLATAANPPDTKGLWAAIAGSRNSEPGAVPRKPNGPQIPFLVKDGDIFTPMEKDTLAAGRTAVGVSGDGRTLFLLVVEGLEDRKIPYGATFADVANWMIAAGASDGTGVETAVSLDGGGSSVMAKFDPATNRAALLNIPYGDEKTPGFQRIVGNYFGIIASPLS